MILRHHFLTPLGLMWVGATKQGICLLEFAERCKLDKQWDGLQRLLQTSIVTGENAHTHQAEEEIGQYFAGSRRNFDLALVTTGTDFQQAVWQSLRLVPYGHTLSYQEQAARIGRPSAVRAVANAVGANRLAIIIPCHRIIGKNGALTGYAAGIARKQWLLEHEKNGH